MEGSGKEVKRNGGEGGTDNHLNQRCGSGSGLFGSPGSGSESFLYKKTVVIIIFSLYRNVLNTVSSKYFFIFDLKFHNMLRFGKKMQ